MRVIPNEDLTVIQKLFLAKSRELAVSMCNHFYSRTNTFLPSQVKKYGALDQSLVCTYFGEAVRVITCDLIVNLKKQMDTCDDGEHATASLWDDIKKGIELSLGIRNKQNMNDDTPITLPNGLKQTFMKTKETLNE
jgi:hypothetical protein